MMRRTLVAGLLVVVVAATLGVVALRGHAGARVIPDALNGRAPTSAELAVSLSTGGSFSTSGTLWIDVAKNAVAAQLRVPLLTADTDFSVRAVGGRLYLTSPNLVDAHGLLWYQLPLRWPSLARWARYVVRPDPALLSLLANTRVSHAGLTTTYEGTRSGVSLNTVGASGAAQQGRLDVRLTTGRQGEFIGIWARFTTPSNATTIDLRVLSYDRPHPVVAPPASRSSQSAAPLVSELLKSGELGSLVVPSQLLGLLQHAH